MPGLPPVDQPDPAGWRLRVPRLVIALPVLLALVSSRAGDRSPADDPPMPDPCIRAPQLPFCQ